MTLHSFFIFLQWLSTQKGEAVTNGYAGCSMATHPTCGVIVYGGNALQAALICFKTGYNFVLGIG